MEQIMPEFSITPNQVFWYITEVRWKKKKKKKECCKYTERNSYFHITATFWTVDPRYLDFAYLE